MEVSSSIRVIGPNCPDYGDFAWLEPKVDTLNPRLIEQLNILIARRLKDSPGCQATVNFKSVGLMTNVAARMFCKTLNNPTILIENANPAVQSSLEWAAEYLLDKGELDYIPWQIYDLSF